MAGGPAVSPGERGSAGPLVPFLVAGSVPRWSAGRVGLQAGDRGGELGRPGPGGGEAQPQAAAAADDTADGGEQAQALVFPGAGGSVGGEHLQPGGQLAGHDGQLAPQLVLREAVQREVTQPGVLRAADAVLVAARLRWRSSGPASCPVFASWRRW